MPRTTVLWSGVFVVLVGCAVHDEPQGKADSPKAFELSDEHVAAVHKRRRIVVNHPADGLLEAIRRNVSVENLLEYELGFTAEPGSQIDAQWWCLDRLFPLKSRPMHQRDREMAKDAAQWHPAYEKIYEWEAEGFDILRAYLEATKKRGLECFYTYRISDGYSHDEFGVEYRLAHPEWLTVDEWDNEKWNFVVPEVRAKKLAVLTEIATKYDFDGMEVDFARGPNNLPRGQLWTNRGALTQFLRDLRRGTLEIGERRGRPFILAARVPDNLLGCHFDGLDIETWVAENLIDILVLGVRSYDLEIERFRQLIGDRPIKVFATLDDHHCTDGYSWPPIEVMRGVVANWWQQGMDGLQTFNWGTASSELAVKTGMLVRQAYRDDSPRIAVYQQAYREFGNPETLKYKDKTFVVQRRGGGGSGGVDIHEWLTPRVAYQNTNMLGQLPTLMDNLGHEDVLLRLRVGDDVAADADRIESLTLHILLSDRDTAALPETEKMAKAEINPFWTIPQLFTSPPRRGIEKRVEVRVNGVLLEKATPRDGWLVFECAPSVFAVGENLVGVVVTGRGVNAGSMSLEKVEVRVDYR